MYVVDLASDADFLGRSGHSRNVEAEVDGLRRLAHVFAQRPELILQELTEVTMSLCSAESAGITLEELDREGKSQFRWIATAGQYKGFLGAVLPREYSPCGTCLERGRPQLFRVSQSYLDLIGVPALPVTDGILIPWEAEGTRGTIWVIAHDARGAFDREDYRLMQNLSDFAAIAVRHQQQQEKLLVQAKTAATDKLANRLAHQINNPLQALVQTLFLLEQGGPDSAALCRQATGDLARLSGLVKELLELHRQD
jgi:signal transduction histidine kinase